MRKVIDGKVYDTRTATYVLDISPSGYNRGDFKYEDTGLYLSPKGQWFIAGHGGPLSRWARSTGQSSWSEGEGLKLVDGSEARELFEQHGNPDDYVDWFGEPEEG